MTCQIVLGAGVGRSREVMSHQFLMGGSFNFQLPMGVGHPVSYRNWHTFDTIDKRGDSFRLQRTKTFQAVVEKFTWLVYINDDNFMYCEICKV